MGSATRLVKSKNFERRFGGGTETLDILIMSSFGSHFGSEYAAALHNLVELQLSNREWSSCLVPGLQVPK